MAHIETTVFISYRRTDVYTALAVYENLKNQGYDVFFDYRSISSGVFEQLITSNIKARAHFLLILTPTALDRCHEPKDWLRREIEIAIEEKRNIVPLFFRGFRFGDPSVTEKLTGKLKYISHYNGLNVHEDYFDEAMHRLRTQYLNIPLNTVLHPVSTEVRRAVRQEQIAADEALEQIENVKELVKQAEETPIQKLGIPKRVASQAVKNKGISDTPVTSFPLRLFASIAGSLSLIALLIWGVVSIWNNVSAVPPELTQDAQVVATGSPQRTVTTAFSPAQIPITPTSEFSIGSTMTGQDGMTLLYVPAGNFEMGSYNGQEDEKPVHTVYLDAFWIDKTEITVRMYSLCVEAIVCREPTDETSLSRSSYYGNSEYDNYPVIYVDWSMAKAYCEWVGRRLPTEAEWEKAARGTDGRTYPWGDDTPNVTILNFNSNEGDTAEVDKYSRGASPYGALNMAGNVWEWVADWYDAKYYATLRENARNPQGPESGRYRILRGGSWYGHDFVVRSSVRIWVSPSNSHYEFGFRCAMDATS